MLAKTLMVQGTASSVGKSLLVAALCRILRQDGYSVAPFKAQNMALNSAVTGDGLEIGRAQAVQAEAAGVEPSVDMNPVLLKPEGDQRSQVVVLGRPAGTLDSRALLADKPALWPVVTAALERLRANFEIVVIEGAGSPAEINLKAGDIANMRLARHAQAPVLLVGDIDRGGVFASLVGTLELLEPVERSMVAGLVINKFRGDPSLLESGLEFLQKRTGKPVLGVLPYLGGLRIAEEDSMELQGESVENTDGPMSLLDVAVLRLAHIANFDDFDLLAAEPAAGVRYVERAGALGHPDLIVLPGSKTTVADLLALKASGLVDEVLGLAAAGTPVLGICGGYQMLGERIEDAHRVESDRDVVPGLGLLPVVTSFEREKTTRRVIARGATQRGCFERLYQQGLGGYEIHMGNTEVRGDPLFWLAPEGGSPRPDGCVSLNGLFAGTYVHGLFEHRAARQALIAWLGQRRGLHLAATGPSGRDHEYDRLAAMVRTHLDIAAVYQMLQ